MTNNDFSIGGKQFKLSKMDAFKQFHIVRRVGPILAELVPALGNSKKLQNLDNASEEDKFDAIAKFAGPVMSGLSKLSDADADLVLHGLLSSVEIQQPMGGWARVSQNNMLMMQDLELPILLQIAGRAFMFNLSGFFSALPVKSAEESRKQKIR